MPTLLSLPEEMLCNIAQHVQRLDDLKSLSLTCWALYHPAMRDMYRKITFPESAGMASLIVALGSRNQAVQYIRHFELVAGKPGPFPLNDMIVLVADRLLDNTLLSFTVDGACLWKPLRYHAIHTHQSFLRTARNFIPELPKHKMDCIRSLQICRAPATLQGMSTVLSKLPLLDTLELVSPLYDSGSWVTSSAEEREPQRLKRHVEELFLSKDKELKLDQLRLRSLVCHGMDLSLAGAVLRRAVDISKLEALTLQKCNAPLALLTHAIEDSDHDGIQIRHLVITADDNATSGIIEEDISEIVFVIEQLETLVLHTPDLPELRLLSPVLFDHTPLLRTLYFNRVTNFEFLEPEDPNEMRDTLFAFAEKLDRVTICADNFEGGGKDPYHDPSLIDLCDELSDSPSLKLVHLLVPPIFDKPFYTGEWARRIAEKILNSVPTLKIVCIGDSAEVAMDEKGKKGPFRLFFARGETLLVGNGERYPGALRVTSSQAREIEPLADLCEMDPLGQRILRFGFTRRG